MKILSVENIRKADEYTIQHEPITSVNLMERAAFQLFRWIKKRVDKEHRIHIYAGLGNNGGDGLVLARMLAKKGYDIKTFIVRYSEKMSDDFKINYKRLLELEMGNLIVDLNDKNDLQPVHEDDIIVDAIFGSGLRRGITGFVGDVVRHMNSLPALKIAIDMPTGLFADSATDQRSTAVFKADYTLTFQLPKLAFLLPENDTFVGKWQILDIGLSAEFINEAETANFYMLRRDIAPMMKMRRKFGHKGTYGHALLIAGSYGKMGAAILASKACLRSGVGLLHAHIPKVGYEIIQIASPETMLSIDRNDANFSEVPDLRMFNAVGIGPGLGIEEQSQKALKLLIQEFQYPIVFDADALNILSENKTWLSFLPKGSILTPHPKEFERLVGKWNDDFEKIQMLKNFAAKFGVYVVLKGAHTAICFPDGNTFFNSSGNPGMATAGSGDVLTGIITGLLAQGYSSGQAAVIGVYLHGLAGDLAMKRYGLEAMVAGDIIEKIGSAFCKVKR